MSMVTIETASRWETSSLLRKLRGHDVYAIQICRAHWLVRSSLAAGAGAAAIEELVAEWALEEGMPVPVVHEGEGPRLGAVRA
jgi:hypothetical protein